MKMNRSVIDGALTKVPDGEVARLAERAISVLLSQSNARRAAADAQLVLLCDALLSDGDEARRAILECMHINGQASRHIMDHVVPEVARHLGRRWANDEIGFAEVTIASARLQESVRVLGRQSPRPDPGEGTPRILMIIPRNEHHTLGAFVAADQLRRQGFEVDVAIDQHPRQVAAMLRRNRYAMIGITSAGRRTLASVTELVEIIRASATRATPVVLGGSVVVGGSGLKKSTGVDHVVGDVETAVRLCGLRAPRKQDDSVAS